MGSNPSRRTTGPRLRIWVHAARVDGSTATALWLIAVSLISFALHWPFLNLPMISDEGGYAYVAQRWLDGRGTLYDDLWVSRPQGIFLAYAAIFHTIGTSVIALRIGGWIIGVLTMLLIWRYGRAWGNRRIALLATLLFAVLSASPTMEGYTANAEVFMALPAAGSALLMLRASRTGWQPKHLLVIGALAGLATFLKPSGIVMLPVGIIFAWLACDDSIQKTVQRAAWMTGGFAAALAPAFVHGYLIGWDNFVFAAISYRVSYQSSVTNSATHHARAIFELFTRTWPLLAAIVLPVFLRWWLQSERVKTLSWTPRLSTARVGIVSWAGGRPRLQPGDEGTLLLRLWLLGCLIGIAMGGDWWYHYLIQIAAPLSLWFAATLLDVRALLSKRGNWVLGIAVACLLLFPYAVIANGSPNDISKSIHGHPGYPGQEAVATYLTEHSPPGTPILVAFGQAALYYLSDRPAAYRYLYDQELRALPQSQDELIAIIESPDRPMYIVGTRQVAPFTDRGQAFWAAVGRHYHWEADVRGVPIYRANPPSARNLTPNV